MEEEVGGGGTTPPSRSPAVGECHAPMDPKGEGGSFFNLLPPLARAPRSAAPARIYCTPQLPTASTVQ